MNLIFDEIINITLHIPRKKLFIIDKIAKRKNISRNKTILCCLDFATENQKFINNINKNDKK